MGRPGFGEEELSRAEERTQQALASAERTGERLRFLHRIAAALLKAISTDQVARVGATEIKELVGAAGAAIHPIGESGDLRILYICGVPPDAVADALRSREPVWLESPEALASRYPSAVGRLIAPDATGACASLPLVSDDRPLGMLALRFAKARRFDPEERAFLLAIADVATQALARARLFEEEERQRRTAEATSRSLEESRDRALRAEENARRAAERLAMAQALTAELAAVRTDADLERVMLRDVFPALGARSATMSTPPDSDHLQVARSFGDPEEASLLAAMPPGTSSPARDAYRTERSVWIGSPDTLARGYPAVPASFRERGGAWAAVPLPVDGRTMGVLTLTFPGTRPFPIEERELVELVGTKYGQAVARLRSLETERRAREEADRARRRAELLESLGTSLQDAHGFADVLDVAAPRAAEMLGADAAVVFLVDPDGHTLRAVKGTTGPGGTDVDLDELPHSRAAADWRRPVYLTREQILEDSESRWFEALGYQGTLVAPLISGNRLQGVLYAHYRRGEAFAASREDLSFASAIARVSALALARANAFEREKAARAQAETAEERARRMAELQERLVAILGHDLRNPLGAISVTTGALLRRGHLDAAQRDALAVVASSAHRMARLIDNLLDFTQARRGLAIPLEPEPMSLGPACERVVHELEVSAPDRTIRISVDGDDRGEWDPSRVEQVVSNLVANALEHGDRASPVEVRVRGTGDEVSLAVHNVGPPIPAELLPELFEPFRRGPPRRASRHIGLGLFIVQAVVAAHGGAVAVRSSAGDGTTFTVSLPRRARLDAPPP
jgi:signal transduction histidine kinase